MQILRWYGCTYLYSIYQGVWEPGEGVRNRFILCGLRYEFVFDVAVAGLSARKGKRPQRGRLGGLWGGGVLANSYTYTPTCIQAKKIMIQIGDYIRILSFENKEDLWLFRLTFSHFTYGIVRCLIISKRG